MFLKKEKRERGQGERKERGEGRLISDGLWASKLLLKVIWGMS